MYRKPAASQSGLIKSHLARCAFLQVPREYVESITYANDDSGSEATKLKLCIASAAMKDVPILSEGNYVWRA
eukprot:1875388-Pleurochrysis_carterae.AAC.1